MQPFLCVLMAVFRPDVGYLARQIATIAAQTQRPDLLVAVIADLTSADLVASLCSEAGLKVHIDVPDDKLDSVKAFERGLQTALTLSPTDALFALCDQDDEWHADRLAEGVAALADPAALMTHSDARVIDGSGRVLHPSVFSYERRLKNPGLRGLLYRNIVTGMTVTVKRALVELALPFPRQTGVHFYHDLWLALLAQALGGLRLLPRPLVDYRQHDRNAIGAVNRSGGPSAQTGRRWRFSPDMAWIRREAAAYGLSRYLAQSLWHRLEQLPEDRRPDLRSRSLRPVRRHLRRFRGTGGHIGDALAYLVIGHGDLARLACGHAVVSAGRLVWAARTALGPGLAQATRAFDDRLFSLSPGVQPEGRSESAASSEPLTLSSLIDARKSARFKPDFSAASPAVVVLVPTLNPTEIFAGIATAIDLGLILAAEGLQVRFIATDLPIAARAVSQQFLTGRLTAAQAEAGAADRITLHCGVTDGTVPLHREDRFVATAWWTAHVARKLIEAHGFLWHRFVYLIQDFEPAFYPWGTEYADALSSYDLDFLPIFNTTLLRDYFGTQGYAFAGPDATAFRPSIDVARHVATMRPDRPANTPRRIALYGRPEVARNLFSTAVESLDLFLRAKGIAPRDVRIDSVGLRHAPIALSGGHRITSLGKLPFEEYPTYLSGVDIGLSLMLSPHPSHLPLEMAAAGARVVTNGFGGKNLSVLSPAIASVAPDPQAIADALARAWDAPPVSMNDRKIDLSALGVPLASAARDIVATLRLSPPRPPLRRRRILLHIGAPKCGSTFLQMVLLRNRDRLARLGIAYPHDGGEHPGNAADLGSFSAEKVLASFGDAHTLIYSHEDLLARTAQHLYFAKVVQDLDLEVQVLLFMRPYSEIVFGTYSQLMKQRFNDYLASANPYDGQTLEQIADGSQRLLEFDLFLNRWSNTLPGLPPIVRSHWDIRATVEHLLGTTDLDWSVPRAQTNPSLRVEDCERIAALMQAPERDEKAIRDAFFAAHETAGQPDTGRTPERIARIEAMMAASNANMLAVFGYDNRAIASKATPPATPVSEIGNGATAG